MGPLKIDQGNMVSLGEEMCKILNISLVFLVRRISTQFL